ncbi:MAG: hypothetical protein MJE77_09620 [Proteobacteria bacterium]|nr:hypothetical protein [Pseudomonadota bacterium]
MQLGFALLEAGLVEAKNAVSMLYKNTLDFCIGMMGYTFIGYYIVWGSHPLAADFLVGSENNLVHPYADLLYQGAFAATAATICSGALAGRMKLGAYVLFSFFIASILYPAGARLLWVTMDGLFVDYAGSVAVHAVGGAAALAGAWVLGPRRRRGSPAHNIPLATTGMFLLLVGWFGFNMGSIRSSGYTQPEGLAEIARVGLNTTLAAASAGLTAYFIGRFRSLPMLTLNINGILGGLVIITANCHTHSPGIAIGLGCVAGYAIVEWHSLIARRGQVYKKIDDPVGAVSVHGVCGILGGLAAAAIFVVTPGESAIDWRWQIGLSIAVPGAGFLVMLVLFWAGNKMTSETDRFQIRVSEQVESLGLDTREFRENAYVLGLTPISPLTVRDRLEVISAEVSEDPFSFDRDAEYRHDKPVKSDSPLKTRMTTWLESVMRLAHMYQEAHGDLVFLDERPADILQKLEKHRTKLLSYCLYDSPETKQVEFNEATISILNEVERFKLCVSHHIQTLRKNPGSGAQVPTGVHEDMAMHSRVVTQLHQKLETQTSELEQFHQKLLTQVYKLQRDVNSLDDSNGQLWEAVKNLKPDN